ncbi:hypothetical protein LINPERPRIM_LOCUS40962, partial [Linum perenne]
KSEISSSLRDILSADQTILCRNSLHHLRASLKILWISFSSYISHSALLIWHVFNLLGYIRLISPTLLKQ